MSLQKIKNCYHSHTKYCNHATLSPEELIQMAISEGFEIIGVSEHVPYKNNRQNGASFRLDINKMENYFTDLNNLKEKYKDQIKIYTGFECEYYQGEENWYKELLKNSNVDYLIFGNHAYPNENNPIFTTSTPSRNREEGLEIYCKSAIKGMKSGLFKYFAHPDVFMKNEQNWDSLTERISREIISCAIECNMALGFNFTGFLIGKREFKHGSRYIYPHKEFWDLVAEMGAKVIIEPDAHGRMGLRQEYLKEVINYANQFKLNIIEKIEI